MSLMAGKALGERKQAKGRKTGGRGRKIRQKPQSWHGTKRIFVRASNLAEFDVASEETAGRMGDALAERPAAREAGKLRGNFRDWLREGGGLELSANAGLYAAAWLKNEGFFPPCEKTRWKELV